MMQLILFSLLIYLLPRFISSSTQSTPNLRTSISTNRSYSTRSSKCPVKIPEDPPSAPDLLPPSSENLQQLPRILNGDLASDKLRPYLASFVITVPGFGPVGACTATMVSRQWLITAAHCVTNLTTLVAVGVNRSLLISQAQPSVRAAAAVAHPLFSRRRLGNDIGVIRLERPAPPGTKFMKVNVDAGVPIEGTFARSVGYGISRSDPSDEPESVSGFLRQIDVPVTSESSCQSAYDEDVVAYDAQVCAGYSRGGCSVCRGDSGGPLLQYNADGEPVLLGIASFTSLECGESGKPTVYVRPAFHLRWLDEQGVNYAKSGSLNPPPSTSPIPSSAPESLDGVVSSIGAIVGVASVVAVVFILALCLVAACFVSRSGHHKNSKSGHAPATTVSAAIQNLHPQNLKAWSMTTDPTADTKLIPSPVMREMPRPAANSSAPHSQEANRPPSQDQKEDLTLEPPQAALPVHSPVHP